MAAFEEGDEKRSDPYTERCRLAEQRGLLYRRAIEPRTTGTGMIARMAWGSFPLRPFASGEVMRVPHPIPYQGSKRNLAPAILSYIPAKVAALIEPFAGSAAVTLAAAARGLAERYVINDLNRPLAELWLAIIESPEKLARQYETLWRAQHENRRRYYDEVRDDFNRTGRPDCLLYLLARCVKAPVRYNANGEFNQSPDNRRMGALP